MEGFMKLYVKILFIISLVFVSCGDFQIPQSVSVKTDADYNFSVGKFSKDISEYVDVKSIADSLKTTTENGMSFTVYDYCPEGENYINSTEVPQQFLAEVQLQEIPVDVAEYLKNMDITTTLADKTFNQEFTIPSLNVDSNSMDVALPDINQTFINSAAFDIKNVFVPQGINGQISELEPINVEVKKPTFREITFSEGELVFHLNSLKTTHPAPADFSANIKLQLLDSANNVITENPTAQTIKSEDTVSLPLAGKSLKQNMKLKISGSSSGGTAGDFVHYQVDCSFSEDTKLSSVKGLTMDLGEAGNLAINQEVMIGTDESFVSCVIKDGSLKTVAQIPENWTGVKAEPNISISGGIKKADGTGILEEDFVKTDENLPYVLNRNLPLAGKKFEKGNIQISGNIKISLNNADLTFDSTETQKKISVNTDLNLNGIESVIIDTEKIGFKDKLGFSDETEFPADMQTFVKSMVLTKIGIEGKYINTLPEGNDLQIKIKSKFMYGSEEEKSEIIKGGTSTETDYSFVSTNQKTIVLADTPKIDYGFSLVLPGSTAENPSYAEFKNVNFGDTYTLGLSLVPVFEWQSVTINLKNDEVSLKNTIDTNFSLGEMFKQLSDIMGDDFINKINLTEAKLYLYCSAPVSLRVFEGLDYIGYMKLICGTESSYILGSEIEPVELTLLDIEQGLEVDEETQSVVISDISKFKSSTVVADVAELINLTKDNSEAKMQIEYDLGLEGSTGTDVTIEAADFNDLQQTENAATSIKVKARLVLPLEIKFTEDAELNINKLANINTEEGKDIFGRTEKPDLNDVMKYAEIVENMTVYYTGEDVPFKYNNELSPMFIFDTGMTTLSNNVYGDSENDKLTLKGGIISVNYEDMNKILNECPFSPQMKIKMPQGNIMIPRKAKISMKCDIKLSTNGTVKLFGN